MIVLCDDALRARHDIFLQARVEEDLVPIINSFLKNTAKQECFSMLMVRKNYNRSFLKHILVANIHNIS